MTRFTMKYTVPASMAEDAPNLGVDVSRAPEGVPTRLYNLLVTQRGNRPMKVRIRAASAAKAKKYAANRWPNSNIIVVK
jgi:hypothetical protein